MKIPQHGKYTPHRSYYVFTAQNNLKISNLKNCKNRKSCKTIFVKIVNHKVS